MLCYQEFGQLKDCFFSANRHGAVVQTHRRSDTIHNTIRAGQVHLTTNETNCNAELNYK